MSQKIRSTDTTQELRVPLPDVLRRTGLEFTIATRRLQQYVKRMPPGEVRHQVQDALIRAMAAAEVLHEQAREVEIHWPKKDRLVDEPTEEE